MVTEGSRTVMPGGGVARRPLHLIIIADCSGGMDGVKMDSLNYAIVQMLQNLEDWDRGNVEAEIMFRVLKFATEPEWHIAEPVRVSEFRQHWRNLSAVRHGWTNMGAAFREVGLALSPDRLESRALRPAIVLVTDGLPTDRPGQFDRGLEDLLAVPAGKASFRAAVAIGADANSEFLDRFIGDPSVPVLVAEHADSLVDLLVAVSIAVSRMSEGGVDRGSVVDKVLKAGIEDDDEPIL
jgi:uncharacterized protein YegL